MRLLSAAGSRRGSTTSAARSRRHSICELSTGCLFKPDRRDWHYQTVTLYERRCRGLVSLAELRADARQGRCRCWRVSRHGQEMAGAFAYRDVRLHGCRAFGELSRAVVEPRLEQAAEGVERRLEQAAEPSRRACGASRPGLVSLPNHSSRPKNMHQPTPTRTLKRIIALRRQRLTGRPIAQIVGVSAATVRLAHRPPLLRRAQQPQPGAETGRPVAPQRPRTG